LLVLHVEVLLSVLQQEGGFSHATRTFDANHAVRPVDLIHERTANGRIDMLHQVSVSSEKSLHSL